MYISSKFKCQLSFNWHLKLSEVCETQSRRFYKTHLIQLSTLSYLVMNPDFQFVLAIDVIVCTAAVGNVLWTSVCTNPTVLETEVL